VRAQPSGPRERHGIAEDLLGDILEPHASLRYVARLFKALAFLLVLLLIAEIVLGITRQGTEAVPLLLEEATRLVVFAGVLWGFGDMALMFIESNHDLRATRVLVWQLNALMKMRMEHEGLEVELIQPPLKPGGGIPSEGGPPGAEPAR
jgi:hypothetical protein